jgi:hypothetical protein
MAGRELSVRWTIAEACGRHAAIGQECETHIAMPATAAAINVPSSAACTNGSDLRKTRRIDCYRLGEWLLIRR